MGVARENLRLQAYIFSLAVPLNLIWEVAQMGAYDFPETTLMEDLIGCFIPSLGDGLMTLLIYWGAWLLFRDYRWILNPGLKGYLAMMGIGLILAVLVEWNALLRTGGWGYNEQMIVIPILGVGILPILQMVALPPATAIIVQWTWNKRN